MPVRLSIVVPVYNVEQYLRKCVFSLVHQDFKNYEVILIDDGSTDSCPDICDEYALKYNTSNIIHNTCPIRVIHQENAGLSAARNTGIAAAKGEYVMFVDSDDYIEPNVLGGLMEQVERDKLDVLRYRLQYVRLVKNERVKELRSERGYEVYNPYKSDPFKGNDYSEEPTDGVTFLNTRMNTQCYAWTFVLRRELIYERTKTQINTSGEAINIDTEVTKNAHSSSVLSNCPHGLECNQPQVLTSELAAPVIANTPNMPTDESHVECLQKNVDCINQEKNKKNGQSDDECLFTPGIYFEDTDWTPRMLVRAKRVASTNRVVYNYLTREGSITNAVNKDKQKKVLDDKMRLVGELQRQAGELQEAGMDNAWFSRMIADTVISIIGILSADFYTERKGYLQQLQSMNVFPIRSTIMKARLINISPRLAVTVLHWKNGRLKN